MAYDPENITNIQAPSTNYPKGKQVDKTGGTPGTIFEEKMTGDWLQFFIKLMNDAGLSFDDTPDNVANGYQLIDALEKKVRSVIKVVSSQSYSLSVNTGTIDTTRINEFTKSYDIVAIKIDIDWAIASPSSDLILMINTALANATANQRIFCLVNGTIADCKLTSGTPIRLTIPLASFNTLSTNKVEIFGTLID